MSTKSDRGTASKLKVDITLTKTDRGHPCRQKRMGGIKLTPKGGEVCSLNIIMLGTENKSHLVKKLNNSIIFHAG
jgi:hypothetical protein